MPLIFDIIQWCLAIIHASFTIAANILSDSLYFFTRIVVHPSKPHLRSVQSGIQNTQRSIYTSIKVALVSHANIALSSTPTPPYQHSHLSPELQSKIKEYEAKTAPYSYKEFSDRWTNLKKDVWTFGNNSGITKRVKYSLVIANDVVLLWVALVFMCSVVLVAPVRSSQQIQQYKTANKILDDSLKSS